MIHYLYLEETTNDIGEIFRVGDWVEATDYFPLIGQIKKIRSDGFVTFKNVSPNGNDIERYDDNITHIKDPYTTAYNTSHGYGSSNNDKTKGSYPYFKQMVEQGNL